MPAPSLNLTEDAFSDGLDSIVIRHYIAGYQKGGVVNSLVPTLPDIIPAGHLVYRDHKTGMFVFAPITEENGFMLLDKNKGFTMAGFTVATVRKSLPVVGIMYAGEINDKCLAYNLDEVLEEIKTQLPQIVFAHD